MNSPTADMVRIIHICAPSDTNGNPRRCYAVYLDDDTLWDVVDEGYDGDGAWRGALPPQCDRGWHLARVNVQVREYQRWLRMGRERRERRAKLAT